MKIITQNPCKILENILKSNCITSELVQKDVSSILLKLQVISRDSSETVRTTTKYILMVTSVFYILQCFSNTNPNNIFNPF